MAGFCSKCGSKINSESKFCSRCGNFLKNDTIKAISKVGDEDIFMPQPEKSSQNSMNKEKKTTLKKIVVPIVCLSISGYLFWDDYQQAIQEKHIKVQTTEKLAREERDDLEKDKLKNNAIHNPEAMQLALDDFILGGVSIDDTVQKVRQVKGVPIKEKRKEGKLFYDYYDVSVVFEKGRAREIWTNDEAALTRRKIHSGLNFDIAMQAYGNEFIKSHYGELTLYEYGFNHKDGIQYILRIAVNSNQKIDYVSVRIP